MDSMESLSVKRLGQISNEGSQCGIVYSPDGIMVALCAGTHGWCNGYVLVEVRECPQKES